MAIRENGEECTDMKGKLQLKRTVKKGCEGKCIYKCTTLLSTDEQQNIHTFWKYLTGRKATSTTYML
jgi:hypothetical protein